MPARTADDFQSETGHFRTELLVHCYQMLGSVHDAEDQVQETMLRAWRAFDRFDDRRGSMRTWLHRIATNVCLTALEGRAGRPLPSGLATRGLDPAGPLVHGGDATWLQPLPDARLGSASAEHDDPVAVLLGRGRVRLALVAAMQLLPARQRAGLILREVLDWPVPQIAEVLGTSTAAVNSALQRARARLAEAGVSEEEILEPADPRRRALVDQYIEAFEKADVAGLAKLLTEDAVLEMPPYLNWYLGREDYAGFIARVFATRGTRWRLRPIAANGQLGVAAYLRADRDDVHRLHTIQLFSITEAGVSRNVTFAEPDVFALFDVPRVEELERR